MQPNDSNSKFDQALDDTLRRRGRATAPAGLEQRLQAALLNQSDTETAPIPVIKAAPKEPRMATLVTPLLNPLRQTPVFRTAESLRTPRSRASIWSAVALHAVAIFLIGIAVMAQTRVTVTLHSIPEAVVLTVPPPLPPPPALRANGGGGGHRDIAPASAGHMPKPSPLQIVPLNAPPVDQPRLAAEPTIDVQKDLKIADSTLPDLGAPTSTLNGASPGAGSGNGIGEGAGSGLGPGAGGNYGGGPVYTPGLGGVGRPVVIYQVEPEFSEEARRNKFSGSVVVYMQISEKGIPDHIRIARGLGMGLDEKAIEAARQYRFKPAMKDGKPVRSQMYLDVNFDIL